MACSTCVRRSLRWPLSPARSVLVEAGSTLNGALLGGDLVDKLVLYRGPTALGPDALPFAQGQPRPEAWIDRLNSVYRRSFPHGNVEDHRVSGYFHDPWAAMGTDGDPLVS